MVERINGSPLGGVGQQIPNSRPVGQNVSTDFGTILNQVRISAHADKRIKSSGRPLSPAESRDLRNAIDLAYSKGSRDALVIMGDRAFVVNVPNRTIITAMDFQRLQNNIITNIDSAVII